MSRLLRPQRVPQPGKTQSFGGADFSPAMSFMVRTKEDSNPNDKHFLSERTP